MSRRPGRLSVYWSRKEADWLISYPRGCDGHLAYGAWAGYQTWPEFLAELELRGYDLKTARFVVDTTK